MQAIKLRGPVPSRRVHATRRSRRAVYLSRPATSPDRFLPDKAIDLVDEAGARIQACKSMAALQRGPSARSTPSITRRGRTRRWKSAVSATRTSSKRRSSIASRNRSSSARRTSSSSTREVRRAKTPAPESRGGVVDADVIDGGGLQDGPACRSIASINQDESRSSFLQHGGKTSTSDVISQERAISAVSRKPIRRSRAGLKRSESPGRFSFMFLGPTGVGKT